MPYIAIFSFMLFLLELIIVVYSKLKQWVTLFLETYCNDDMFGFILDALNDYVFYYLDQLVDPFRLLQYIVFYCFIIQIFFFILLHIIAIFSMLLVFFIIFFIYI